ncbi:ABC-F family ATP-binding cassette domain-containing protein [bacterium]|nr:ABC-F family ATP-binding cassette domain-containing protein [bacterium]
MPLLTVDNLTKYYGTELILDHVAFAIDHRERLGFIGANGTGKTTLCRILLGREPYEDDAEIHIARGATIGYLSQEVDQDLSLTPWDMVMSVHQRLRRQEREIAVLTERMAEDVSEEVMQGLLQQHATLLEQFAAGGGHEYEREAARVLTRVGVPAADFHRPLSSFSGGEQRRAALARLLLQQPDLLLLDEPTNHLDVAGIEWLEQYLKSYAGAVIAISHDRRFLDNIAQRILELEACDLAEYRGGYSDYVKQKEERLLVYERTYERQQQELKKQMSFIRWALGTQQEKRVRAAKSRMKLIAKTEYLDPPVGQRRKMNLRFHPRIRGGQEILHLQGVGKRFGDRQLFAGLDLFVRRQERVGIVGPNGSGKTTLLRMALGLEEPSEGTARLGTSVEVGYYRQEQFDFTSRNTVMEEFATVMPDAEPGELRSLLARFLFVEDDVSKRVDDLSGGEKSRLALAKLVMTRPTLLVLDEPTNHLDIDSCNALENALREYAGTIVVVSHDRYFLDSVVNRLVVFHDGGVTVHEGNYGSYAARMRALREEEERLAREQAEAEKRERLLQEKLARQAKRARLRAANGQALPTAEELEERIHALEGQLALVEKILADPETYQTPQRVAALNAEHEKLSAQLAQTYEQWEQVEGL